MSLITLDTISSSTVTPISSSSSSSLSSTLPTSNSTDMSFPSPSNHPSHPGPHSHSHPGPPPSSWPSSPTDQVSATAYDPAHSEGFGGPLAEDSLKSLSHALPIYIAGAALFLGLIVLLSVSGWYIRRRRRINKVIRDFGRGRESKEWKRRMTISRDGDVERAAGGASEGDDQGWVVPTLKFSSRSESQEAKIRNATTNTNAKKKEEDDGECGGGDEEAAPPYEKVDTKANNISVSTSLSGNQHRPSDSQSSVITNNNNNENENGSTVHIVQVPAPPLSHIDNSENYQSSRLT